MRILFLWIGCFFSIASNAQLDSKGMDQYDLTNRVNRVAYDEPQWVEEAPGTKASIKIFPAQIKGKINPLLIGYNIEDINCAFFPGLYAQMLYGESFEDEPNQELPQGWIAHYEPINPDTPKDTVGLRKWRGAWAFEDGAVYLTGCRQRRIHTNLFEIKDGTVECEVNQSSLDKTNFWGPSLLFCKTDKALYSLQISYDRQLVELRKGTNPNTYALSTLFSQKVAIKYDTWNKFKIIKNSGLIQVYFNGNLIIEYRDDQPLEGGVGLDASGTNAWFRNLKVTDNLGKIWSADFKHIDRKPYNHADNLSRWWDPVETGTAKARFKWSKENPYNTDRCQMVEKSSGEGLVGIYNTGVHNSGLSFRTDMEYNGRLYIRGNYTGDVTIALQSRDGVKTYASTKFNGIVKDWKRFDFKMVSQGEDTNSRFAIIIDKQGEIFVDQVILMPGKDGLYKGLPVRKDLGEKLVAGIHHLRFGGDMINQKGFADWQKMIIPQDKRRQYLDGWSYHKSAQFMVFEFLDYCEAAGVVPIPNFDAVPAIEISDFLDYCNGDATNAWGKKRIENGREKPYNVEYFMLGNGLPPYEEMKEVQDLLKKNHPKVKILTGDLGHVEWVMQSATGNRRYDSFRKDNIVAFGSRPEVSLLSSHLTWLDVINKYKEIFPKALHSGVKLYAEEVNGHEYSWQRGMDDALFTIVSEQNCDVVYIQSFCNALHASGHLYEWNQGHIFFTGSNSWYQPSGWVVKILGENLLPLSVQQSVISPKVKIMKRKPAGKGEIITDALWVSTSVDELKNEMVIKAVNIYAGELETEISIDGLKVDKGTQTVMNTLNLGGRNTEANQGYITPSVSPLNVQGGSFVYTFKPMSVNVLRLKLTAPR